MRRGAAGGKKENMVEEISREELKAKIDRQENFFLVETLDEDHYQHAHLPGAINLPPGETNRAEDLISDKSAEVVVYCASPP